MSPEEFKTAVRAVVDQALDGPKTIDDETRDRITAHVEEAFTESQMLMLEETFNDLVDCCYTARRRAKRARERRAGYAAQTLAEAVLANPTGTLAGALAYRPDPPLHAVEGGEAA